jgi:hypothetical protein
VNERKGQRREEQRRAKSKELQEENKMIGE